MTPPPDQPVTDDQLAQWGGSRFITSLERDAIPRLIAEVQRLREHVEFQGMVVVNREQFAALEAQLVTMRGALEHYAKGETVIEIDEHGTLSQPFDPTEIARSALSSSTDYAEKVVVDREEYQAMFELAIQARSLAKDRPAENMPLRLCVHRLDAISEGGMG